MIAECVRGTYVYNMKMRDGFIIETDTEKIRLGISACLLGQKVRYDGQHKLDHFLADRLGKYVEWVAVCPEVECGLTVPREAMHLVGDPENPKLVTIRTGIDHTASMKSWAAKKMTDLEKENLCGFVFKSRSPSSGMRGVKIYNEAGMPVHSGAGLFAKAFMARLPLIPVEDESRMHDSVICENFIKRIFVLHRWKAFMQDDASIKGLIGFHTAHKLLLMAHSPKHYSALGKLVADPKAQSKNSLMNEYIRMLMEGLAYKATASKNTNVLYHMMGYFKKQLTADEKAELGDLITSYNKGLVPLNASITLINHYVRKYDEPYLKQQYYFNSHPLELSARQES
jgi:uncharacterized protein YbgA (DUF1722 family)/uncharacterized protein YbbK (DUF523 family)